MSRKCVLESYKIVVIHIKSMIVYGMTVFSKYTAKTFHDHLVCSVNHWSSMSKNMLGYCSKL